MKYALGPMYSNLLKVLAAAPSHTLVANFAWEDRGLFGPKTKRYTLMIKQVSEQEAKQRFNYVYSNPYNLQKTLLILAFAGDLPPSIIQRLSPREREQGSTQPFSCSDGYLAQGFMVELGQFGVGENTEWDAV